MELLLKILFFLSGFIIFWAMIGYPFSIKILDKLYKDRENKKDYSHTPSVTVMVVAHNEEKVILEKLKNLLTLDYPRDKIEILVASDNSTDKTNDIVRDFIKEHPEYKIRLYEVKERKGKTNAQNEAQKTVTTEYLVMTDANSILDRNAIRELMASFTTPEIAYVTGRLIYLNADSSDVSYAESSYWSFDLTLREIESRIQTITAGNGALYACRNSDYHDFDPIQSHDSAMPVYYALQGKRAIANHNAIAYEKAGEVIEDELKRKVRMNRTILKHILPDIRILNIFKYKWFSYFYLGHRTFRYLLWLAHFVIFLTNIFLINEQLFYFLVFIAQVSFYLLALFKVSFKMNCRIFNFVYYYCVTILAQWIGVYKILTGKAKPFWEKAESTR